MRGVRKSARLMVTDGLARRQGESTVAERAGKAVLILRRKKDIAKDFESGRCFEKTNSKRKHERETERKKDPKFVVQLRCEWESLRFTRWDGGERITRADGITETSGGRSLTELMGREVEWYRFVQETNKT